MHHQKQKLVCTFGGAIPPFWLQLGQGSRTTEISLKIYDTRKAKKMTKTYMCWKLMYLL